MSPNEAAQTDTKNECPNISGYRMREVAAILRDIRTTGETPAGAIAAT